MEIRGTAQKTQEKLGILLVPFDPSGGSASPTGGIVQTTSFSVLPEPGLLIVNIFTLLALMVLKRLQERLKRHEKQLGMVFYLL